MSAYLLLDIDIHDKEKYEIYKKEVPAFIAKHGGTYLSRGGQHEVIEGDFHPTRLVLFRFPNRKAIHNMLNDPDYQPLKAIRSAAATSHTVAFDGLD
ncbi:MAG: DUF1330 domain-containing protein [Burkholderiales bacterium]|nr:DUF1330 domain-containing protein [Burkholderiales bacterium]MCJ7838796.1 DUF1330 domain-containing protein [Burkholderiales bacterium]